MRAGGRMFRLAALVLVLAPLTALAAENPVVVFCCWCIRCVATGWKC